MSILTLVKSGILLTFSVLIALTGRSQLRAAFSATPTSGCTPLVVNFTDSSTGNPTQWKWDFGNGIISFLQNPSTTYFTPGQYNIKLVVTNASGKDSITRSQYITIFPQPVVDFSASVRSGCFPLPVQFSDLSTTQSGTISQWQWDFGDGNFGNTQNPQHTYTAAGNYNVSLVVFNSHGCSKSITKTQYIQISSGVTANFTSNAANNCSLPVSINFQNTSTGTGTLNYQWNFGDGGTSTLQNPSHTYSVPGSFTVQLIVTNSTGCSDTITRNNAVTVGTTQTMFTVQDSVCAMTILNINNTSNPLPSSQSWNFGDGTNGTAYNPVKFYSTPGNYQIKLVNNFGACTDSITKNIVVLPLPVVNFTSADTIACKAPFTVNFTSNTAGAVSYQWSFGDGDSSTLPNPVHIYTVPGNYTVSLTCTNIYGCIKKIIKPNFVKVQLPQAAISNLPQQGCAPLNWTFTSTLVSPEPATTYQWNFGDGGTSALPNPTHSFGPGTFNIQLIISTASGCTDTVVVNNGIRAGVKPHASFIATPRDACANIPVNFFDSTIGTVTQWHWDFGDGSTSTQQNPIHLYTDTGYFNIQLIVWNNGCPDTMTIPNFVHIKPPIAAFNVTSNCTERLKRVFTDHSVGADEWNWDFGDGNTSNIPSPVHIYAAPGVYTVSLTVKNYSTGCTYTASADVRLIDEVVDFTSSDTITCRNTLVNFTAVGSNPLNVDLYYWIFGDAGTGTGHDVTHTYHQSGFYDVSLILVDLNNCRDTLTKLQYIKVYGPTPAFSALPTGTCLLTPINFIDSSYSDGLHPLSQWIWNYGDGIIDTLTSGPFQHSYTSPGVYSVSLTVSDTTGCTDSLIKPNFITISKPIAGFTASDSLSCPGKNIQFLNSSTGPGLVYSWDFGDGTTSNSSTPVHAYAADGIYTIKLTVFDLFGCSDSMTRIDYITIVSPHAIFSVSDSAGTCPPLIVNFTNTSLNDVSQVWDFGDGTSSSGLNPSHFYNTPGIFTAILTVTGPGGCTSTKQQIISVKGPSGIFNYAPLVGCSPLTVNFSANTLNRVSIIWDFADGSTASSSDSVISHTYTILGSYVPKMILIGAGGCTVAITGPDTVFIHGVVADFISTPQVICNAGSVQFNNTSISNDAITGYTWNFGDGSTSSLTNPVHFYGSPGQYFPFLQVSSSFGCTDSMTSNIPVKVISSPQGQITRSPDGCVPVSITFNGSLIVPDTSAVTWLWDFGNGDTTSVVNPPVKTYDTAGTYPASLYVTNSSGCKDTIVTSVQAFPIPAINAGIDTFICRGTGRTLQATGGVSYTWTPATGLSCTNCSNPLAMPDSSTTYAVNGANSFGCVHTDSIFVKVFYPFSMNQSRGDTLCVGKSVKLFASGAASYVWSPSGSLNNANLSNPMATPLVTTQYQVIGTDDKNCFKDTALVPVTVYNFPQVDAGPDRTINIGQTIDLVPALSPDVNDVLWSPTGSIFRSSYPSVTVKPKETTTYTVEVKNAGGCTAKDNVTVYVVCDGANVFIPNTFSPNGDGVNDIFYPRGTGLFSIKTSRVFNRWGELVYERSDFRANEASMGWDGTYKGVKLNVDVYVYVLEVLCDNSSLLTFKGNIALIK